MEEFKELFLLLKEYIDKQKEDMTLGAVENLTKVLSALVMGAVAFTLGCIVLVLVCFALAYFIAEETGSMPIGFASMAAIILMVVILFWFCRKQWVVQPLARLMVSIFFGQQSDNKEHEEK